MSTVEKAFTLLRRFAADRAEIGLSDMQRLSGRDKATTYRYLCALESVGLLEQDSQSRAYRIGPAVPRLAHLRELTMPRCESVRLVLPHLKNNERHMWHAIVAP